MVETGFKTPAVGGNIGEYVTAGAKLLRLRIALHTMKHSKQVNNFLNELKGVTVRNSKVPRIMKDGRRIDDNLDVANELNTFFVGIGQKTKEDIPNEVFVSPQVNNLQSMWFYETNCNEILQIIEDLKEKSSAGIDDISTISKYSKFPSILKQA